MTDTVGKEKPEPREFVSFLLDRPKTHNELSEGLYDVVQRVRDTGKAGKVTLVVTIKPFDGDQDTLAINDEIKLTMPEHDRKPSIFYPDHDGNLTRTDPNQLNFDDLRDAPAHYPSTGELREV